MNLQQILLNVTNKTAKFLIIQTKELLIVLTVLQLITFHAPIFPINMKKSLTVDNALSVKNVKTV